MEEKYKPTLFVTHVDAEKNNGCILQILFKELSQEEEVPTFASPLGMKKKGGGIKFSKLQQKGTKRKPSPQKSPPVTPRPMDLQSPTEGSPLESQLDLPPPKKPKANTNPASDTIVPASDTQLSGFTSGFLGDSVFNFLWLRAGEDSFESFDDSIFSSNIDPVKTFHEAKTHLDDIKNLWGFTD